MCVSVYMCVCLAGCVCVCVCLCDCQSVCMSVSFSLSTPAKTNTLSVGQGKAGGVVWCGCGGQMSESLPSCPASNTCAITDNNLDRCLAMGMGRVHAVRRLEEEVIGDMGEKKALEER